MKDNNKDKPKCKKCKTGFELSEDGHECLPTNCDDYNGSICTACKTGYKPRAAKDKCFNNENLNCSIMSDAGDECASCPEGRAMKAVGGKRTCVEINDSSNVLKDTCQTYKTDNSENYLVCQLCKSDYQPADNNQFCVMKNCGTNTGNTCDSCADGYTFTKNKLYCVTASRYTNCVDIPDKKDSEHGLCKRCDSSTAMYKKTISESIVQHVCEAQDIA